MSSKPDSSDKLEKRLPAGGQAVTGVGSGGRGELGVQQRGGRQGYPWCRGAEAGRALGLALQIATWPSGPGEEGAKGPQTMVLPGQGLEGMGRAGNLRRLSARLENGQLQEDGQGGWWSQRMEYPPWGLASCWGRKLLRVKVPPPDTGVWGVGGHGESEGVLGLPQA